MDTRVTRRGPSRAEQLALASLALGGTYAAWGMLQRARTRRANAGLLRGRRVVILGAGFAGIHVAEELARLLPDAEDADVTIVDEHGYLLFTPMLTEVAGGELAPQHIVAPTRALSPRVRFVRARVEHVDLAARHVRLGAVSDAAGDGQTEPPRALTADHLVLALGSVSNFHDTPGAAEHALTMKSLADATAVRDRTLALARRAVGEPDHDARSELLTVVVGGGGYTGVETMAAVNDLLNDLLRDRAPDHGQAHAPVRTVLVEAGDRLLPELSADLAAFAQRELERRGVEVRLKTKIARVDERAVELEGGERIPTRTLIWAAGVSANPVLRDLPGAHDHDGRLVVDGTCAVPGHAGVWAIGDCAAIPQEGSDTPYGATAQNATREGTRVARNIVATLRGQAPQPFTYRPIGELALVGRRAGVANVYGHHLSGLPAWALWRAVYLGKLPGTARRARVALDWLGDLAAGPAARHAVLGTAR